MGICCISDREGPYKNKMQVRYMNVLLEMAWLAIGEFMMQHRSMLGHFIGLSFLCMHKSPWIVLVGKRGPSSQRQGPLGFLVPFSGLLETPLILFSCFGWGQSSRLASSILVSEMLVAVRMIIVLLILKQTSKVCSCSFTMIQRSVGNMPGSATTHAYWKGNPLWTCQDVPPSQHHEDCLDVLVNSVPKKFAHRLDVTSLQGKGRGNCCWN